MVGAAHQRISMREPFDGAQGTRLGATATWFLVQRLPRRVTRCPSRKAAARPSLPVHISRAGGLAGASSAVRGHADHALCECADPHCVEPIYLTAPEYEAIRGDSTRFAVMVGLVFPEAERTPLAVVHRAPVPLNASTARSSTRGLPCGSRRASYPVRRRLSDRTDCGDRPVAGGSGAQTPASGELTASCTRRPTAAHGGRVQARSECPRTAPAPPDRHP